MRADTRQKLVLPVSWAIWGAGAAVLYILWHTRLFDSESAESIFGFVLLGVCFFYFLAMIPIQRAVKKALFP